MTLLGDRPLAEMGKGKPVDALDIACKAYKDCQRCARMKHGETCLGEFTKYKFGLNNNDYQCKNSAGECSRDLCECDLAFAKAHAQVTNVYDVKYHAFWGPNNGFDKEDESNCVCKLFIIFKSFLKSENFRKLT